MPPGDSALISAGSTITVASYSRPLVDIGPTTLTRPEESPVNELSELSESIHCAGVMTAMDPSTSLSSASTAAAAAGGTPAASTEVMTGATPVSRTDFGTSASGT